MAAQLPSEQAWPAAQTVPQLPQLFSSVSVSAQMLEQRVSLAMQLTAHSPSPLQNSPSRQAAPHAPQLLESLDRLAQ